jgi:predicted AlkP superfamily phosphohydrolase/phosphomutase
LILPLAYVGPGAGFAFLGSFLSLFLSVLAGVASLFLWPFRALRRAFLRRKTSARAHVRRVVFLGLDGLDPRIAERLIDEGKLPNLARLKQQGAYRRLATTYPALSPVAWSTFSTGVNPARHNIFDFLNRDLHTYTPELAAARVSPPRRYLSLGRLRIPLSPPTVEMRRKSEPFWKTLGRHGISSTILRVPVTFPPDDFPGRQLSAMPTPDLLGTQGTYSFFITRPAAHAENTYLLTRRNSSYHAHLPGPSDPFHQDHRPLTLPFTLAPGDASWTLEISGAAYSLRPNEYSSWVHLRFHHGPTPAVHGLARFLLRLDASGPTLYATPIQIDPEHPALPISHPRSFSIYLAKLLGSYSTAGLAEDTWAMNDGVLDEDAFLAQAYSIQREREAMFFSALDRTRSGAVACVFDTSDRIQHMFFRHMDGRARNSKHRDTIEHMYQDMDRLAGETMRRIGPDTALFVLSDHGFQSFRRGVNLNSWLHRHGYLALQPGLAEGSDYLGGIDWSRTRAYSLGLGGIYLNRKGREAQGIVEPDHAPALRAGLIAALSGLHDDETGDLAIRRVYSTAALYNGPYLDDAPDLVAGYAEGYRVSWDGAKGRVTSRIFEDNDKAWSGDHCVDPALVPGVLFSNLPIEAGNPGIEDMAPTALHLLGVPRPQWMEGQSVIHFA